MLFIYQIKMGSLGEYVFCATSLHNLYNIILKGDERLKYEILYNYKEGKFFTFGEFKTHMSKWITKTPLHLGYLGGYAE